MQVGGPWFAQRGGRGAAVSLGGSRLLLLLLLLVRSLHPRGLQLVAHPRHAREATWVVGLAQRDQQRDLVGMMNAGTGSVGPASVAAGGGHQEAPHECDDRSAWMDGSARRARS